MNKCVEDGDYGVYADGRWHIINDVPKITLPPIKIENCFLEMKINNKWEIIARFLWTGQEWVIVQERKKNE